MCDSCVRAITVEAATGLPLGASGPCTVRRVTRRRADTLLAERGLAPSRTAAAATVRAGRVRLGKDGSTIEKPSELVPEDAELVVEEGEEFVSRGGIKLNNALDELAVEVEDRLAPRRRRVDRGLHRLPATARRADGDRGRRRLRAARLAPAPGLPRSRHGAAQRQVPGRFVPALSARADHGGRLLHLAGDADALDRRHRGRGVRPARPGEAAVRARQGEGGEGGRRPRCRRPPRRDPPGGRGRAGGGAGRPRPGLLRAAGPEGEPRDLRLGRASGEPIDLDAALEEVEP